MHLKGAVVCGAAAAAVAGRNAAGRGAGEARLHHGRQIIGGAATARQIQWTVVLHLLMCGYRLRRLFEEHGRRLLCQEGGVEE